MKAFCERKMNFGHQHLFLDDNAKSYVQFKLNFGYYCYTSRWKPYWFSGKSILGHSGQKNCKNKVSERLLQEFTSDLNETFG